MPKFKSAIPMASFARVKEQSCASAECAFDMMSEEMAPMPMALAQVNTQLIKN